MRRLVASALVVSALLIPSVMSATVAAASDAGPERVGPDLRSPIAGAPGAGASLVSLHGRLIHLVGEKMPSPGEAAQPGSDVPALAMPDGRLVRLRFSAGVAEAATGTTVDLAASMNADGSATVSYVEPSSTASVSTTTSTSSTSQTSRRLAILLVNFLDDTSQPWTTDQVYATLFGTGTATLTRFYRDVSYGGWSVSGDVFGWYTLSVNAGTGCDYSTWASLARSAAGSAGVDLAAYTNVAYAFPNRAGCAFSGLSEQPGSQIWLNNQATNVWITAHELGHNLGLDHGFGLVCTTAAGDQIPAAGTCTDSRQDYDDPFDTMGASWDHTLFNAPHRADLGVLDAASILTVNASGTYSIIPEASTGTGAKMLRIPAPDGIHTVDVELRAPFGLDSWSPGQFAVSGITMRRETSGKTTTDLLNVTGYPSRWDFSPVRFGHTLVDALDNLSIKLVGLSGGSATVQVGLGDGTDTTAPTSPSNLVGLGTSPTQATLSWTASTDDRGLAGYAIYRNGVKTGQGAPWDITYVDLSATAATTYTYTIYAFDEVGNRSAPQSVSVTTPASGTLADTTPPTPPTGLQAQQIGPTSVVLGWTRGSDNVALAGDAVYRDGVSIGCGVEGQFYDFGLAPGSTHTYTVYSTDRASLRSAGTSINVTLPANADQTPPTAPSGLSVASAGPTSIALAWTAATDDTGVAGYQVTRDGSIIGNTAFPALSDTGLPASSTHTYTVAAYDAAGNSSPAVTLTASTGVGDIVAPSVPGPLVVGSVTSSSVGLSWTAATDNVGVTGYWVFRNGVALGTTSALTYTDSGLPASTTYTYAVAAYDAAGNVGPQTSATATTGAAVDTVAPSAPSSLTSTSVSTNSLSLAWNASTDNAGVAGYRILRGGVLVGSTAALTYTDLGLTPATTYSYAVEAYDAAGNQSAPATVSVTTTAADTTAPTAPTNLSGVVKGGKVNLSWSVSTDNVGVTGYRIWRNGVQVGSTSSSSYVDNPTRGTWTYYVVAVDAAGNVSLPSNSISIVR